MPTLVLGGTPSFDSGLFDDGSFDGDGSTGPILHGPIASGTLVETFALGGGSYFDLGIFDAGIFDPPSTGPILVSLSVQGTLHYVPLSIALAGGPILADIIAGGSLFYLPPLPSATIVHDQDLGRFGSARGDYAMPTLSVTGPGTTDAPILVGSASGT